MLPLFPPPQNRAVEKKEKTPKKGEKLSTPFPVLRKGNLGNPKGSPTNWERENGPKRPKKKGKGNPENDPK